MWFSPVGLKSPPPDRRSPRRMPGNGRIITEVDPAPGGGGADGTHRAVIEHRVGVVSVVSRRVPGRGSGIPGRWWLVQVSHLKGSSIGGLRISVVWDGRKGAERRGKRNRAIWFAQILSSNGRTGQPE